jgi:hypothetical protein
MNLKQYKKTVEVGTHKGVPDIKSISFEYRVSLYESKGVKFTFLEHAKQFEDLLQEAGYEEVKNENNVDFRSEHRPDYWLGQSSSNR